MNVQSEPKSRQKRFRAALALAGISLGEWAERHDVSRQHLLFVVKGERESLTLLGKVDAFIAEHLPDEAA